MPRLEVSSEVAAALKRAARERGCSPAELIAVLLDVPPEATRNHPLVQYVASAEFRAKFSDADRYLALLAWIARTYPAEFNDFVAHAGSRRKYVSLRPEEIRETCHHNQARQIPDTKFWAIMNLDTATKRRFLRRLLVFVGAPDDVIGYVTGLIGK